MKRMLAFLLALVMVIGLLPGAALAVETPAQTVEKTTDYQDSWAQDYIKRAMDEGWVNQRDKDAYRPTEPITRAEFIDMINRMMGYSESADLTKFQDVKQDDWFYSVFSAAVAAGYIQGDEAGNLRPEGTMTRTEAFVIFARISGLDTTVDHTACTKGIADWEKSVPDWGKPSVAAAVANGYVNGTGVGIDGAGILGRAETAALLARKHDDQRAFAFPGHYTLAGAGSVVISGSGITVELAAKAKIGDVIIEKSAVDAKLVLNAGTEIKTLKVTSGAADTAVSMEKGAKIKVAELGAAAKVTGTGLIAEAKIGAPGVEIARAPAKVTLDKGITALINGKTVSKSTTTGGGSGGSAVTYTVTFQSNGGSQVSPATEYAGDKLARPQEPTREGYLFTWWYRDEALTEPWDFENDKVNANLTLYAKWMAHQGSEDDFKVVANGAAADIYVDGANDFSGVVMAAENLKNDILSVSGIAPRLNQAAYDNTALSGNQIIIGTIGESPVIDMLIADGKLDVTGVTGLWESFAIQVVENPVEDVSQALVVAGSDKRGTIFGIYDLSEQIGVSPWCFWGDAAPEKRSIVTIAKGVHKEGEPSVQYRGIFINDEKNLATWAHDTYEPGKWIGPKTYEKIFELLLRLKANYIWPAMHEVSDGFNFDPEVGRLAGEMGIVVGSTHCDILLRNNVNEWRVWLEEQGYPADTAYDYTINPEIIREYWTDSVVQNKDHEVEWTLGMRGVHDDPFNAAGAPTTPEKVALLEQIMSDQRAILEEHVPAENRQFQMLIPYREVLDLYDSGLEVPDDVTIMWVDDNHGFVRRLPTEEEQQRSGGHGMYYHLSYLAAWESYLWLNSIPLTVMREELEKTYDHGVDKVWILNVGDLKPTEIGMEFFLNYAWDVDQWNENANDFLEPWARREFGAEHSQEIADITAKYYQITNTRKPEHLKEGIFNATDYGDEAQMRMSGLQDLFNRGNAIYEDLPKGEKDSFYEMVLYQIRCAYYMNLEYYYSSKSGEASDLGKKASANNFTALSDEAYQNKVAEMDYYSDALAGGKWKKMTQQEYASYKLPTQVNGAVEILLGDAMLGVLAEGYTAERDGQTLEFFSYTNDTRFIDVFNKGAGTLDYTVTADQPWIQITGDEGTVIDEDRVFVSINWATTSDGDTGTITVRSGETAKSIAVSVSKPTITVGEKTYIEGNGYVSMEAEHFTNATVVNGKGWEVIKDLGRISGDMVRVGPTTAASVRPEDAVAQSPCLEYKVHFTTAGTFPTEVYRLPTISSVIGQKLAISIDDGPLVTMTGAVDERKGTWSKNIVGQIEKHTVNLTVAEPGEHTIKVWMIDAGITLDKIVVYTDGVRASYFGPPESYNSTYNVAPNATYPALTRPIPEVALPNDKTPWGEGTFLEADGKLAIEAEAACEESDFANKTANGGGSFILSKGGTGEMMRLYDRGLAWTAKPFDEKNPELSYNLYISKPGTYHVWLRAMSRDNASDSIYAGVDTAESAKQSGNFDSYNKWVWQEIATFDLAAGFHDLKLWAREDGFELDKIYLTVTDERPNDNLEQSQRALIADNAARDSLISAIFSASQNLDSIPLGTELGDYSQAAYDALLAKIDEADAAKTSPELTEELSKTLVSALTDLRKALVDSKNNDPEGYDYAVYEDFEGNVVGKVPFGLTVGALTNATATVAEAPDGHKSLRVTTATSSNATLYYKLDRALSGKVALEAKYWVPSVADTNVDNWVNAMYVYDQGTNGNNILYGLGFQKGMVRINDGSQKPAAPYEVSQWVELKLVIDTEATNSKGTKGTATLYVNGEAVTIGSGENYLRNSLNTVNQIMFGGNKNNIDMYIDYFKVYQIPSEPVRSTEMELTVEEQPQAEPETPDMTEEEAEDTEITQA